VLHKGDAHIDHIIAVEQGGSDDDENLQLLHGSCHSRKTIRTRN
jgi:5-methylcytosine-specific restriction endonuclease McrA